MKWIIILIVSLFCMNLVSANDNTKKICEDSYYFIIEKMNNNNINYTESDLNELTSRINTQLNANIDSAFIEKYIKNYTQLCKNETTLAIPNYFQIGNINNTNSIEKCNLDINKTVIIDMDLSFDFIRIDLNTPCSNINTLKYIFRINEDEFGYYIDGVKYYWLVIPLFFFILYQFMKSNSMLNKALKRLG